MKLAPAKPFDTTNLFGVGVSGNRVVILLHSAPNPLPLVLNTHDEALNLVTYVSVLANISDEELLAARRALEAT